MCLGSDRITPRRLTDIETTNEKEGLQGVDEAIQPNHPLQSAHQEPDTGSKQYMSDGNEYVLPHYVVGYGEEPPTQVPSDGVKYPHRSANAGHESRM